MRVYRQNQSHGFIFRTLPIIIIIIVGILTVDARIRPVVQSMARHQAQVYATKCINDSMASEMHNVEVNYNEIISITSDSTGEITSIQTNMANINKLKTNLTQAILQDVQSVKRQQISVPIGTIFGNELLSGRGPGLKFELFPIGTVQTEIYTEFVDAGINQTLHRIILRCEMDVQTIFPGYIVNTPTVTNYCVAETVIVGKVPQGYFKVN